MAPQPARRRKPELVADASSDLRGNRPGGRRSGRNDRGSLPFALALAPMAGPDAGATGLGPDRRAAERMPLPCSERCSAASPEAGGVGSRAL